MILARADDVDPATGANRQNALFGTYIWNEDETTATFATQPYRDQDPKAWADIVRTYITDELLYQDILDTTTGSVDGAVAKAIKDHPDEPAYRDLLQHYAIPGKLRCVQCHMGSPTQDFVLGFIPLQVKRRATGTGGTYERDRRRRADPAATPDRRRRHHRHHARPTTSSRWRSRRARASRGRRPAPRATR